MPIEGCPDYATKDELQELRDQLNKVLGEKEGGGEVEIFRAGGGIVTPATLALAAFYNMKGITKESITSISMQRISEAPIWQGLKNGTAQLIGFKGNGTKAPITALNQVGKVAGQNTAGVGAAAKAGLGAAGGTLLLANLAQIGANLALNIATVNVLDGRIDAEARGASQQIDAVNDGMLRLYSKQQGDIDEVVRQLDLNNEIAQNNKAQLEGQKTEIISANAMSSDLSAQVNEQKNILRDLKTANRDLVADINSSNLENQELFDSLIAQATDLGTKLDSAEDIINKQTETITAMQLRIEKLELKVEELESKIEESDREYALLKDEFLLLKEDLAEDVDIVNDRVTLLEGRIVKTQKYVKQNRSSGGSSGAPAAGAANAQKGLLDLANGLAGNPITVPDINAANIYNNDPTFNNLLADLLPQIQPGTMTPEQIESLRTGINDDFNTQLQVTGLIGLIDSMVQVKNQTSTNAISQGVQKGICSSLNGGGCSATPNSSNSTQGLGGLGDKLGNKVDALNAALNVGLAGQNSAILNVVQNTNNVVNSPTFGLKKVQEYADIAWKATHADKALSLISTTLAIHNGMMLSNNLGATIGEAASMGLEAIGQTDSQGNPFDINGLVRGKFTALLTNILGAEQYAALTAKLAKANRIYQASVNVLDTTRNLFDSAQTMAEIGIEHTGQIGNALRESGTVAENAYGEMLEKVNPQSAALRKVQKFREGVDNIENVVSTVAQVSSEVVEVRDNFEQLKTEKENLAEEITLAKEEQALEREADKEESKVTADINTENFDRAPSE